MNESPSLQEELDPLVIFQAVLRRLVKILKREVFSSSDIENLDDFLQDVFIWLRCIRRKGGSTALGDRTRHINDIFGNNLRSWNFRTCADFERVLIKAVEVSVGIIRKKLSGERHATFLPVDLVGVEWVMIYLLEGVEIFIGRTTQKLPPPS